MAHGPYTSIEEIKAANEANGGRFFDLHQRVHQRIYAGKFFVTSARSTDSIRPIRYYAVRQALENGRVEQVGDLYGLTRYGAHKEAARLGWIADAERLGGQLAACAAAFVVDGNSSRAERKRVLDLLRDGDPLADEYLPAAPNLSGEWADSLTPQTLFEMIVGREPASAADGDVVERLADAFEQGVGETFSGECERILIGFVEPAPSATGDELALLVRDDLAERVRAA
jgi:hypothetical protein